MANIKILNRSIVCPEDKCRATIHNHTSRAYLLDLDAGLECRNCGKKLGSKFLSDYTDDLTAEEKVRFLPGKPAAKDKPKADGKKKG